jgi:hypothetical protein
VLIADDLAIHLYPRVRSYVAFFFAGYSDEQDGPRPADPVAEDEGPAQA